MKPEVRDTCELTNTQLAGMAKQRDGDAFGELTQSHRRRCANFATAILRQTDEAEEEAQHAWKTFRPVDQFQLRHCRKRDSTRTGGCAHIINADDPAGRRLSSQSPNQPSW